MTPQSLLTALVLALAPVAASAVTIDVMPTAARTVLSDGGIVSADFQTMDPADFDSFANPLGVTLGTDTPYDWEIQFDATSGFDNTKDYSGFLDFDFQMVQAARPTVTSTLNTMGALTGVTLQWLDTNTFAPIGTAASLINNISTTTLNAVAKDTLATLRVSWTGFALSRQGAPIDFTPNIDFNVTATPVPVPAALPLMASAFGVMGLISRRRRKAA